MRLPSSSTKHLLGISKNNLFTKCKLSTWYHDCNPTATATATTTTTTTNTTIRSLFLQSTTPLLEQITVKVPSMGDSITEGTVIEWTAKVGQSVQVDDVVALIETDKVTVDIKAQTSGVIVKQFVQVDQDVEVGKDLYVIDSTATATGVDDADADKEGNVDEAIASSDRVTQEEEGVGGVNVKAQDGSTVMSLTLDDEQTQAQTQKQAQTQAQTQPANDVRIPSIHFLGKEGWLEKRTVNNVAISSAGAGAAGAGAGGQSSQDTKKSPNLAVTILQGQGPLPSNYGRMRLTEREMEDLGLGGAAEAPYASYDK